MTRSHSHRSPAFVPAAVLALALSLAVISCGGGGGGGAAAPTPTPTPTPTVPTFTSPGTKMATAGGGPVNIVIPNTGGDVTGCSAPTTGAATSRLPDGLTVGRVQSGGKQTCAITGTVASAAAPGTYAVTITATSAAGAAMIQVTIVVPSAAAPMLTSPSAQTATIGGAAVNIPMPNAGGDAVSCSAPNTGAATAQLPDGLAVGAASAGSQRTCVITGTVAATAAPGTYTVAITATNAAGPSTADVTIEVSAPATAAPMLTSPSAQTATIGGAAVNIPIPNAGGDAVSCSAPNTGAATAQLPDGLAVGAASAGGQRTCVVTGTVAATAAPGTYTVAITATNAAGPSTADVTIEVSAPATAAPMLTSPSAQTATIGGAAVNIPMPNAGGDAVSCSAPNTGAATAQLPDGLAVGAASAGSQRTCVITGTVAATAAPGTYTVAITATNAAGPSTADLTIEVSAPPPPAPQLGNIQGTQTYTIGVAIAPLNFDNGGGPVAVGGCAVTGGSLPLDLMLRRVEPVGGTATCQIYGTPAAPAAAAAAYTITATNVGGSDTATVTIAVTVPAPDITDIQGTQTYHIGVAIAPLAFDNGGGPVAVGGCAVTGGSLPLDLMLRRAEPTSGAATCEIYGTPAAPAAAAVEVTITATNAGGSDTATVTIAVTVPAPDITDIQGTQTYHIGVAIAPQAFDNGGGPVAVGGCAVTGGSLPLDLMLRRVEPVGGTATCEIYGTPAAPAAAAVEVTITATNAGGSDTATVTIATEVPPPVITAPELADVANTALTAGTPASVEIPNTGGAVQADGCALASGSLPAALALEVAAPTGGGHATCRISGTPGLPSAMATYTVTGTNTRGSSMAMLTITVNPALPMLTDASGLRELPLGEKIEPITFANASNAGGIIGCVPNSPLPAGLAAEPTTDRATCQISGTPTALTAEARYTITAANVTGQDMADVAIAIVVPAPDLQSISPAPPIYLNVGVDIPFPNSGGDVEVGGCMLAAQGAGAVPTGLAAERVPASGDNAATCQITGAPSALTQAPVTLEITGRNSTGMSTTTITVTVQELPASPVLRDIAEPQSLLAGMALSAPIAFANISVGGLNAQSDPTPGCAVWPDLPAGLSIGLTTDGDSCQVDGTPMAGRGAERTEHTVTASNLGGSGSATVSIIVHPSELARALGTHLAVGQDGSGGDWAIDADGAEDGTAAASSGAVDSGAAPGAEGRSCLAAEVALPGRFSFEWRSGEGQGALGFVIDDEGHALPDTGEWESVHDELAMDGAATTARLSWCHPGDADGALLDNVAYIRAPTGLEAGAGSATQVNLRWDAYPGAAYYTVLRGDSADPSAASEVSVPMMQSATTLSDTGLASGATHHYWVMACSAQRCSGLSLPAAASPGMADADGDGLIEISTPGQLHSVRFDLAGGSLKASAGLQGNSDGCPVAGCAGYELFADIDFDGAGADGATWSVDGDGDPALDFGDHHHRHFNALEGGWEPIGDCGDDGDCATAADNASFDASFEGNGRTIGNLATIAVGGLAGLFGTLSADAEVRNLGLVDNLAARATAGLAGGIAAANEGDITASYTTGPVLSSGDGTDRLGGLVGRHLGGAIQSCFATGDVISASGDATSAGGLAGDIQSGASITASYAVGDVAGSGAGSEGLGGLVGRMLAGDITASWAGGNVDAVGGAADFAGRLVGAMVGGDITASWGFGVASNSDEDAFDGSSDRPSGATMLEQLTIGAGDATTDVPASWNQADSSTLGAWDLGTASQTPALNYADYDGATMGTAPPYTSGHLFHCADDTPNAAPAGAALIAGGCATPSLIPDQREPLPVRRATAVSFDAGAPGQPGALLIRWGVAPNADGYRVFRGDSGDAAMAVERTEALMLPIADTEFEDDMAMDGATYYYWVQACSGSDCLPLGGPTALVRVAVVDADGDGLIEIATPAELNNIRLDLAGASYRTSAGGSASIIGCPGTGCFGYELTADISFDSDGDGTWSVVSGTYTLDADDSDAAYFDTAAGGWAPVGASSDQPFTATFDGAGYSITGLATLGAHGAVGMFGFIGEGAVIRNLELIGNLAAYTGTASVGIGGLIGRMDTGAVTNCSAAGDAVEIARVTGADGASIGGLVGTMRSGAIAASFATGNALSISDNTRNRVGGLVGSQFSGSSIAASYATGDADGGAGDADSVGGLVGVSEGTIAASYATGDADGGGGDVDLAGGLVGTLDRSGSITASYATGGADGGGGTGDRVGALVGRSLNNPTTTASWGFGDVAGVGTAGLEGSNDRPSGVTMPQQLTTGAGDATTDVPATWNQAASSTLGAWDLGGASEAPALNYADYDGSGRLFHCADGASEAPDGAALIVGDCATPSLIPGQRALGSAKLITATGYTPGMTGQPGALTLSWRAAPGADGYRVFRGDSDDLAQASEITGETMPPITATEFMDDMAVDGATYHYWVLACLGMDCLGYGAPAAILARTTDADGDGLIEITTLQQLHNIRFVLDGTGYRASASAASSFGCPADGCFGYELAADLDFDTDDDGSTWSVVSGAYTLDADDSDAGYFNTGAGGWAPVGATEAAAFDAVFEGNGHTISNLATVAATGVAGMFGWLSADAEVRNLGLVNNLAVRGGSGPVGGIAAINRGDIAASYTTGPVFSSGTAVGSRAGGLVGRHLGGSIQSCFSTGDVTLASGNISSAGGLAGDIQSGASITASYATGGVTGSGAELEGLGGLVGRMTGGDITASWASGDVDAVSGTGEFAGKLVGSMTGGDVTASWGFGDASNSDEVAFDGSGDRPSGAATAQLLTTGTGMPATDVPASWSQADGNTLGAWDLGMANQTPALNYADYDGAVAMDSTGAVTGGDGFHCADDMAEAPDGATLIAGICATPSLIANQRALGPAGGIVAASYTPPEMAGQSGTLALEWEVAANADGYRVFRGDSEDDTMAVELTSASAPPITATVFEDSAADADTAYYYWVLACGGTECLELGAPTPVLTTTADADGDGLIEIATLQQLHNIRFGLDGAGYRPSAGAMAATIGCPAGGCFGYELTADLDFNTDDDGSTWSGGPGTYALDADDSDAGYFNTVVGGWAPVGATEEAAFNAVFEGNGRTISNLATVAATGPAGMFGYLSASAEVRNLGLVNNLATRGDAGAAGGIAAVNRGDITASYTTGPAYVGGTESRVGGLVGRHLGGAIQSCFATGDVGAGGLNARAGGLVSDIQSGASITASYATGDVTGSESPFERLGGLVGRMEGGGIAASWASGDVNAVSGLADYAGKLLGQMDGGAVAASWGFGDALNNDQAGAFDGSGDRPSGAATPQLLTTGTGMPATDVPASWSQAASNTLGAWDLGMTNQVPVLNYADYDGDVVMDSTGAVTGGDGFHCADDTAEAPDGATLIAGICATPSLIANQRALGPAVGIRAVSYTAPAIAGQDGTLALEWQVAANADGYRVFRGDSDDPAMAVELTSASLPPITATEFEDSTADADTTYYYWVQACGGTECLKLGVPAFVLTSTADADGDGLIEIATLQQLHNIRFGLDGAGYRASAGAIASSLGCPADGCFGYELTADLDFDTDGDGSTWSGGPGTYALDTDDHDVGYFDTGASGWAPVGATEEAAFNAVFEGNGRTISNLATVASTGVGGMFGYLSARAEVRNLGLVNNLAVRGVRNATVGGIAAVNRGDITASYTTGPVFASGRATSRLGGLVGRHLGGAIQSCFATGDVTSASSGFTVAGGLVGDIQRGASITASYATGGVTGSGVGSELLGGLVGRMVGGGITASWAGGDVNAAAGAGDYAGKLVGRVDGGAVTASWGFGDALNNDQASAFVGSGDRPSGASTPQHLSFGAAPAANTNVPASWNQAGSSTLGAWHLGVASQVPAINYADYDGAAIGTAPSYTSGHLFHCADDTSNTAPAGAALVTGDCATPSLIPGQRVLGQAGGIVAASYTPPEMAGQSGALTLRWRVALNATGYRVFRGDSGDTAMAVELTGASLPPITATEFEDSAADADTTYYYWVLACDGTECLELGAPASVLTSIVDADGDGLIEIATLQQLHNIRFGLDGVGYRASAGAIASSIGCPAGGCLGYELAADLDFDTDDDGAWSGGPGTYALDADDRNTGYFDTGAGGWAPVGASAAAAFDAVFEGNGRTISNLATVAATGLAGMFGHLSADAEVRNLGLVNNLAARGDTGAAGGIAAVNWGDITASYTTGPAYAAGTAGANRVGGLVGRHLGGAIQSCFATGDVGAGGGNGTTAGGLASDIQSGASITASYATGGVTGSGAGAEGLGGLVGWMAAGDITASWAGGKVDAVSGAGDYAGKLVGAMSGGDVTASWGFGDALNNDQAGAFDGSDDRPSDASTSQQLTTGTGTVPTDVPASWSQADGNTLGAWDLGTANQTPALNYADYDGDVVMDGTSAVTGGDGFHCADDTAEAPDGATLIAGICATPSLIANQRALGPAGGIVAASYTAPAMDGQSGALRLRWRAAPNATGYRVFRGDSGDTVMAVELTVASLPPITATEFEDSTADADTAYYYWVLACDGTECLELGAPTPVLTSTADADGDGLIEIATLQQLHNIRFGLDGAGYRASAGAIASSLGCPAGGCFGYELMADLDFDTDDDGAWSGGPGTYALDADDSDAGYFDTAAGGWEPVGASAAAAFDAVFEGNGRTISNLATVAATGVAGMFGWLSANAEVRNLGLVNNLAVRSTFGAAGGIAAVNGGDITASYTTGPAYSSGTAGANRVGGLVGRHLGGAIQSCFATGDVGTGGGNSTSAGGLASDIQSGASITASYATGDVTGSGADAEGLGGLVGWMPAGDITASWAGGDVDAVSGAGDYAGKLVGAMTGGAVTASWGFGEASNNDQASAFDGSGDRPTGAATPQLLTTGTGMAATDVPASWSQAASNTLGAWNLGAASQAPALNYADYDGAAMGTAPSYTSGHLFHCADDTSNTAPAGAAPIAGDCATPSLIPGQRVLGQAVGIRAASYTAPAMDGQSGTLTLRWPTAPNATGYRVFRGDSGDTAMAVELTVASSPPITATVFEDSTANADTAYYYWVLACDGTECLELGAPTPVLTSTADADGDGLIEIATLQQLHNIRFGLGGAGYRASASAIAASVGCPAGGCLGYELMADLDFDTDDDGSTWSGGPGSYALDTDDHDVGYFDTGASGWEPVGASAAAAFDAVFEGNGRTISNLATVAATGVAGMFGYLSVGAEVRNLGLVNNLAVRSTFGAVGGIAAVNRGDITASYATGPAYSSGTAGANRVGGLVGRHLGGAIQSCFATGDVGAGGGNDTSAGGLASDIQSGASITASYATGDVTGSGADAEGLGGLVGWMPAGDITASWAGGDVDAVSGAVDYAGKLVGAMSGGTVTASWGFGDASNNDQASAFDGSGDRPTGAATPQQLTIGTATAVTDVPASWNQAGRNTLGAWNLGTASQAPVLNYADYDGAAMGTAPSYTSGHRFHCADDTAEAPDGATLIAGVCDTPSLIANQRN